MPGLIASVSTRPTVLLGGSILSKTTLFKQVFKAGQVVIAELIDDYSEDQANFPGPVLTVISSPDGFP